MSFTPSQIRTPDFFQYSFNDASTPGTWQQADVASQGDYIAWAFHVTNNDTIAHNVKIASSNNDNALMFEALVPAGAGLGGVAPYDVLAVWMATQYQYFVGGKFLGPFIYLTMGEAINTGKLVVVSIHVGYV